jgi:hypothetical protein
LTGLAAAPRAAARRRLTGQRTMTVLSQTEIPATRA